jgi:hypothetical protein
MQVKRAGGQEAEKIPVQDLSAQDALCTLQDNAFVWFDGRVPAEEAEVGDGENEDCGCDVAFGAELPYGC